MRGPPGCLSLLTLFVMSHFSSCKPAVDNCDWEGSSISNSVIPISLRCTRGYVKWHYPDSGLRITLNNGVSKSNYFRGYFSVEYNTSSTVVIYIQGNKALHRLFAPSDGKSTDMVRSFLSNNGTAVIYMESMAKQRSLPNDVLKFNYHLVPIKSRNNYYAGDDECRPCSEEEVLSAYCESDIVLEGRMRSLQHNQSLERSQLTVQAAYVHKDLEKKSHQNGTYVFHHPLKCDAKFDPDSELLIIGQWILGRPTIRCAPKLDLWQRIKAKAVSTNSVHCMLH